jgi:hypothetical protein
MDASRYPATPRASAMTEPLSRAVHYRKEAAKFHELAKFARPAYLGDFYRRVASRYLVMAEDISRWPRRRGEVVSERTISPTAPNVRVRQRLPR